MGDAAVLATAALTPPIKKSIKKLDSFFGAGAGGSGVLTWALEDMAICLYVC